MAWIDHPQFSLSKPPSLRSRVRRALHLWWRWLTYKRVFIVADTNRVTRHSLGQFSFEQMRIWPLIVFIDDFRSNAAIGIIDLGNLEWLEYKSLREAVQRIEEQQREELSPVTSSGAHKEGYTGA